ncbi:MAG: hypothetical protein ABIJ56_06860 [Pseudomonadota bacterium]
MSNQDDTPDINPNRPLSIHIEPFAVGGKPSARMAVVLAAPGCVYARRTGGCRFCGFQKLSTRGRAVSPVEFERQADVIISALRRSKLRVEQVDLYNSGSFLADEEIPSRSRMMFIGRLSQLPGIRKILIEARPEHVTDEKLRPLVQLAGGHLVDVGMGLESASDAVRNELMGKGFMREDFERAAGCVAACGASLLAYVLAGAPGLSPCETFEDCVETARFLKELALDLKEKWGYTQFGVRMALQPAFVAAGSALEREHKSGNYRLISLWTVVDIVLKTAPLVPTHVALWDEGLSGGRVPEGCEACSDAIRSAIREFNTTGSTSVLKKLSCSCRPNRHKPE